MYILDKSVPFPEIQKSIEIIPTYAILIFITALTASQKLDIRSTSTNRGSEVAWNYDGLYQKWALWCLSGKNYLLRQRRKYRHRFDPWVGSDPPQRRK